MHKIRVGTRGSQLALWQAAFVRSSLMEKNPGVDFEQVIIKTEGDIDQNSSLTKIGGQGVFTKEIERALMDGEIDIAVHSLKDLPSSMPEGLMLAAVPERGPVEDVLVTVDGTRLSDLPAQARMATGSIRRKSQLLHMRPDLVLSDLRGNIDTRLKKLRENNLHGIIMARAALHRLKLEEVKYVAFSIEEMIPAVGQGAVGIQVRSEDALTRKIVGSINHWKTLQAVSAERELLHTLDSGCQFPVGAHAVVSGENLRIRGFVGSEDGSDILREELEMKVEDAHKAGKLLAEILLKKGAGSILTNFLEASEKDRIASRQNPEMEEKNSK